MRGGGAQRLHHRIRASKGMVTAEFAIGLLAVMPVLLSLVMLAGAAAVKVQVVEGARTAARMLARGDAEPATVEQVRKGLPRADIEVTRLAGDVTVHVRQHINLAGILPDITVDGSATTPLEAEDE